MMTLVYPEYQSVAYAVRNCAVCKRQLTVAAWGTPDSMSFIGFKDSAAVNEHKRNA